MSYSQKDSSSLHFSKLPTPEVLKPFFERKALRPPSTLSLILFWFFFFSRLFSSADMGIIVLSKFRSDLRISDLTFGLIGSFPSLGRALGFLLCYHLMKKKDYLKIYVVSALFLKAICFMRLVLQSQIALILLSRFLFGICQAFEVVFIPSWCKEFMEGRLWHIFFLQSSSPLGFVFGYLVTFLIGSNQWMTAFALLALISIGFGLIAMLSPYKFYKHSMHYLKKNDKENDKGSQANRSPEKSKSRISLMRNMLQPLCLLSLAGRAMIMFIIAFMQFWLVDYLTNSLNVSSSSNIFLTFTVISCISPLLGTIGDNYLQQEVRIDYTLFLSLASITIALLGFLLPFISNFNMFVIVIWLLFVLLSAVLSSLTEITRENTPKHLSKAANAMSNCIISVLGNFSGISLYGLLKEKADNSSRLPMHLLINTYLIGLGFVLRAYYEKWKRRDHADINANYKAVPENNPFRLTTTSDISNDVIEVEGNIVKDIVSIGEDDAAESDTEDNHITLNFHLQNHSFYKNQ